MKFGKAWVVSQDKQTAGEIAAALERQSGCDAASVTAAQWCCGSLPLGIPDCVVLDLREPHVVLDMDELHGRRNDWIMPTVPRIGIIAESLVISSAVAADQVLEGFLGWPFSAAEFSRALAAAHKRAGGGAGEAPGQSRRLTFKHWNFETWEPALFPFLDGIEIAARQDITILLIGETGTGKTSLAQIVHGISPRKDQKFLTVPCGSLSQGLIESELFGYVQGAFTGADRSKLGKFDVAEGGTILLDEIDALDPVQQARLLRVLDTGEFEPVGSNITRQSNVRCIVASNLCLERLVRENRFRSDLLFRLTQIRFEIPPLRNRPRDIVPLAISAIEECCRENRLDGMRVEPQFLTALRDYAWPGNVRELRNEMRRCVLFASDGVLRFSAFSSNVQTEVRQRWDEMARVEQSAGLAGRVAKTEQHTIEDMLRLQRYNRAATARALGISRVTLYNKIRKYGIQLPARVTAWE